MLRPVDRAHRARLEALVRGTGLFREGEVDTAVELLDESLGGDPDYRFIGAFEGDDLVGYACWGPTPGTERTYDLYWIVVDRARHGRGVGSQLLRHVEAAVRQDGGRLIVVHTSDRADYAATRGFYETRGYLRAGTIRDYYAEADDLVIYVKDVSHGDDLAGTAA